MITQVTEYGLTYNHATGDYFFVVYNSERVIIIIDGTENTVTDTIQDIIEFETMEEALAWIAESGLIYEPEPEPGLIYEPEPGPEGE